MKSSRTQSPSTNAQRHLLSAGDNCSFITVGTAESTDLQRELNHDAGARTFELFLAAFDSD